MRNRHARLRFLPPGHCSSAADPDSYAWIPGSTGCYKCVKGVPKCTQGTEGASACSPSGDAPSEGFHIVDVAVQLGTCALASPYLPPATAVCDWKAATPTLQLSLWVDGTCKVVISPITDKTCSNPLRTDYTFTDAPPGTKYSYAQLQMTAYYETTTTIRSLLPMPVGGATTSRCVHAAPRSAYSAH